MTITINWTILIICLVSIPLLHLFVGGCLWFIRWTMSLPGPSILDIGVFWIGTTERAVAIMLFALDQKHQQVAWFIGVWVGLKFALNWKRRKMGNEADYQGAMIALVGNVLSFGSALLVACWITSDNPSMFLLTFR